MRAASVLVSAACLLAGCSGDPGDGGAEPGSDAGARSDGGPVTDGGQEDADASGRDAAVDGDGGTGEDCRLPAASDVGAVYERTLYVAPDGDDAADGSEGAPLASIGEAVGRATAGTRILVRAGTYGGQLRATDLHGAPGRPIGIVGEGEVTLDASGSPSAIHLSRPRHVVVEGMTVTGGGAAQINIDDGGDATMPGEHVVLRNLAVRGSRRYCIKLAGVSHFWVLDNVVEDCGQEGIDVVGGHDGVIAWNVVRDMPDALSGIQVKMGSADVLIVGNRIQGVYDRSINLGGSGRDDLYRPLDAEYEATRLQAIANVIEPAAGRGIAVSFSGCVDCVFANNTVYRPATWVGRILVGGRSTSRDGLFANNLVVLAVDDLDSFINVGAGAEASTFTFANNLWLAIDRDASWPGPELAEPIPPEVEAVVQRDPELLDPESGDFQIPPTSPAAGAGRPLEGDWPDHDGRCFASPPSIGAFEAVGD